jgi:hypothetical protein
MVAVCLLLLLLLGCSKDEFTPPQDMAACSALADRGVSSDPSAPWRLAVDDTSHALDDSISVYVCTGIDDATVVTVGEAQGVSVSPDERTIGAGASLPVGFEVALLDDDAGGRLQLELDAGSSSGTMSVRAIVDGDEWTLELPY